MDIDKIDIFLKLTESLSRYRRAELKDESSNENLIEELYVDPLENDLILKTMLQNNTTLLIGLKGTGKSIIINRFQHEIRKSNTKLSLYIDVKDYIEFYNHKRFHETLGYKKSMNVYYDSLKLMMKITLNPMKM